MGRHKKPTDLKVLAGNPGKRPINKDEVKPPPATATCPSWLDRYAKEVWKETYSKLEKNGQITESDLLDFTNLCISAGMIRKAYAAMKKVKALTETTPSGYRQQIPEIGIINTAIKNVTTLCAKFGMSPSDRAGLVNPKAPVKRSKLVGLLSR